MRKFETTIPISVEKQVEFDALQQPHEICAWDKRRKCDSYYIQMYKEEKKKIEKAVGLLNWVKDAKDKTDLYNPKEKDYIDSLLEILKGEDESENN